MSKEDDMVEFYDHGTVRQSDHYLECHTVIGNQVLVGRIACNAYGDVSDYDDPIWTTLLSLH